MSKIKLELKGLKFNSWTVIGEAEKRINGCVAWHCICDCGTKRIVRGSYLKSEHSKSCGCVGAKETKIRETTHGMTQTPLHKIWLGIKNRCYNKNTVSYRSYGGRGIKVCERWLNSFENFLEDMSPNYKLGLTIERKDVNKDYSPENCCWIPKSEQSRNRTNTIWVTTELGVMTVSEAAKIAGTSWFCMYNRHLRNCPTEKLLLPPNKAGRSFTNGENTIN